LYQVVEVFDFEENCGELPMKETKLHSIGAAVGAAVAAG